MHAYVERDWGRLPPHVYMYVQNPSKIFQKWFKIVAKMVQNRGLGEVWEALGAYLGVLGRLGHVLGRLGGFLGGVLGASWGVLGGFLLLF